MERLKIYQAKHLKLLNNIYYDFEEIDFIYINADLLVSLDKDRIVLKDETIRPDDNKVFFIVEWQDGKREAIGEIQDFYTYIPKVVKKLKIEGKLNKMINEELELTEEELMGDIK